MSVSYNHILTNVLLLNGVTLSNSAITTNISVSSMNSSNLNLNNTLSIYSFLTSFIIKGATNILNLEASSQILDLATIIVTLSSTAVLTAVNAIRIDTILIDQTQMTATNLIALDFQTMDYSTNPNYIVYVLPTSSENMLFGLCSFYFTNKNLFYFSSTVNTANITVAFETGANAPDRIVFKNLNFMYRQCPGSYPYLDVPSLLCFNFDCLPGNYWQLTPTQVCLPCLYDCATCTTGTTCQTCNTTVDFRIMDNTTSRCIP